MTCFACGEAYDGHGRFCPHCGILLRIACPHCGQLNSKADPSCSACQNQLQDREVEADPPPDPAPDKPLERRQLTIMFTDLVNSTGLADSMDPEDFRVLIEAHRTIAIAPIMRYGGVVARYLGDGMLVYFGYPEAHEDDPDRAVRAGLEIVEATKAINQRWVGEGRGRIAVRIGIHTGIVVVGDVLKADVRETMAVFGNAPSLAARLQGLAEPNSVVLSGQTKDLLRPSIRCQPRGRTTLKGIAKPVAIFTALEVAGGTAGLPRTRTALPFVNRQKELATVRKCWASAKRGRGRAILLAGDPGIGKSRLIRAIEERVVSKPCRWLTARTSPYATNSDFFAFSELFHHLLGHRPSVDQGLEGYSLLQQALAEQGLTEPEIALGFAGLLGIDIPDEQKPASLQPERARDLTITAIATWFDQTAKDQPVVLVIEDLHWADASTLEVIDRLQATLPTQPILLIKSTRGAAGTSVAKEAAEGARLPEDATPTAHAASQASAAGIAGTIWLDRLAPEAAQDLLDHVIRGAGLPEDAVSTLLERANGVPLFLEELPKPIIEAGVPSGLGSDSQPIILPATLRDSLMAQLDRMGSAKAVAQTGAVLGHSFEDALLRRVWNGDPQSLNDGLAALTDAALLTRHGTPPDVTYAFKHALIAEIAYDSLLRQDRRNIHQQTANTLVAHFHPLPETRPELIARHYAAAGDAGVAFDYWLKAGSAAARRSANTEAIGHLRSAEAELDRVKAAASTTIKEKWFLLYMAKVPILVALLGWGAPEVEDTLRSALSLASAIEVEARDRYYCWGGMCNVHLLRGDMQNANEAVKEMQKIAEQKNNQDLLVICYGIKGLYNVLSANYEEAKREEIEAISLIYSISQTQHAATTGTNPNVISYSVKSWAHYFLGEFLEAEDSIRQAIDIAAQTGHQFSMCYARCLAASLNQFRERVDDALADANAALLLSAEHAFAYWQAWANLVKGWALSAQGQHDQGVALVREGLEQYEATGAAQMKGYGLCLAADACLRANRPDEALADARAAIAEMQRTGIIFYLPEAHRLLGEALGRLGEGRAATFNCLHAANLAKRQRAVVPQIRALSTLLGLCTDPKLTNLASTKTRATLDRLMPQWPADDRAIAERMLDRNWAQRGIIDDLKTNRN